MVWSNDYEGGLKVHRDRIAELTAELDAHKAALRLAMAMYAGLSLDSEQAKCDAEIAAILGGSHPLIAERDYLKCLERARAWVDANVDARLMDAYDAAVYGDEAKARALLEAGNE